MLMAHGSLITHVCTKRGEVGQILAACCNFCTAQHMHRRCKARMVTTLELEQILFQM